MRIFSKIIICVSMLTLIFLSSGCSEVVTNSADELTQSKWSVQLDNGNKIALDFDGDKASLSVTLFDNKSITLSGLCELSSTAFVIHDENTKIPYAFTYIVHFDRVEIVYGENTVSLYKS
ncbi:MAG: hypothetical protein IJ275_04550 [Ruminococcus sp.]|nr:hypothetical protein [Ruminococcus sp.]